jgi:hypothetical protein
VRGGRTADTGPAPQSIPFASRVRCLAARSACRRRARPSPRSSSSPPPIPAARYSRARGAATRRSRSSPRSGRRSSWRASLGGTGGEGSRARPFAPLSLHTNEHEQRPTVGRCTLEPAPVRSRRPTTRYGGIREAAPTDAPLLPHEGSSACRAPRSQRPDRVRSVASAAKEKPDQAQRNPAGTRHAFGGCRSDGLWC